MKNGYKCFEKILFFIGSNPRQCFVFIFGGHWPFVPLLLLGPPFFPIILFGSTTLLTGMMGTPCTCNGLWLLSRMAVSLQESNWFFVGSNSMPGFKVLLMHVELPQFLCFNLYWLCVDWKKYVSSSNNCFEKKC
jgi:hypothetical protein